MQCPLPPAQNRHRHRLGKMPPWFRQKRGMPMKAAFIERLRGPEVLTFGEMPDPVAAAGEVVVDIVAASVHGADWKVREGKSNPIAKFPCILGRDFSGVVSGLGEGVTDLRIGDEVFGVCDMGQ